MSTTELSRRAFLGGASALCLSAASGDEGWVELFDGASLNGWRASGSRLFYNGPVQGARFRNFELEVEALTARGGRSGVLFHNGFEVLINNSDRKKTGSLFGIRHVYKQLVADDEWFKLGIAVRGKNVQVRLNGTLLVDYDEPDPPYKAPALDQGTFAIPRPDAGTGVRIRRVRVRPQADDVTGATATPVVADATFKRLIDLGAANYPVVDFHAHLKGGLTLEQVLAKGRREGIGYGIAVNGGKGFPIESDAGVRQFAESMKGQPVFVGMQAEGREWTQMFSRFAAAMFDYVFTDSMTWTDRRGKRMRLWIPEEVGTIADTADFMDTLVERAVGILENEPIDIYVNPTFLPASIAADYDKLWTEARMRKVVEAAARNKVAVEINDRYKLPSARFIGMAKAAGCKFTFGTNNAGPEDLKRCEYGIRIVEECKLEWQDFFVPAAWWPKAVDRKPGVLRG